MTRVKRMSQSQAINNRGTNLLRELSPDGWVLREYHPDYGIDFALELFSPIQGESDSYEALGEHLFIQLKSTESVRIINKPIYERFNVEKFPDLEPTHRLVRNLECYSVSVDTSLIATVERMGIGIPVLLVVADLENERCCFVCLNDYIDKILTPGGTDYRAQESVAIHVPVLNDFSKDFGRFGVGWYGKRMKLLAAFDRFHFQYSELFNSSESFASIPHFIDRIIPLDIWEIDAIQEIVKPLKGELLKLQEGLTKSEASSIDNSLPVETAQTIKANNIWTQLNSLAKVNEDIWREWFLPTAMGVYGSYDY